MLLQLFHSFSGLFYPFICWWTDGSSNICSPSCRRTTHFYLLPWDLKSPFWEEHAYPPNWQWVWSQWLHIWPKSLKNILSVFPLALLLISLFSENGMSTSGDLRIRRHVLYTASKKLTLRFQILLVTTAYYSENWLINYLSISSFLFFTDKSLQKFILLVFSKNQLLALLLLSTVTSFPIF